MPQKKKGPKGPNRQGVSLHVYVRPHVDAALQSLLSASEPRVSKTALVEAAVMEYYERRNGEGKR